MSELLCICPPPLSPSADVRHLPSDPAFIASSRQPCAVTVSATWAVLQVRIDIAFFSLPYPFRSLSCFGLAHQARSGFGTRNNKRLGSCCAHTVPQLAPSPFLWALPLRLLRYYVLCCNSQAWTVVRHLQHTHHEQHAADHHNPLGGAAAAGVGGGQPQSATAAAAAAAAAAVAAWAPTLHLFALVRFATLTAGTYVAGYVLVTQAPRALHRRVLFTFSALPPARSCTVSLRTAGVR